MVFDFNASMGAVGGFNSIYAMNFGGGGEAEPEPEVTTTMLRSPMRSVMRNPMAAVMSPRLRTEK